MISGDLSTSRINRNSERNRTIPKIKLPTMIRLGLFQMGLGIGDTENAHPQGALHHELSIRCRAVDHVSIECR